MAIRSILWPLSIFCVHLVGIVYSYLVYFPRVGMLYQEKSGNPATRDFPCLMNQALDNKYGQTITVLASAGMATLTHFIDTRV
jgi:hypothetical protein